MPWHRPTRPTRTLAAAAAAALLLVTATACGDSSNEGAATTTTQASAAEQWANDVCFALVSWRQNVVKAGNAVKQNPSKESLEAAANHVRQWTQAVVDKLHSLTPPQTESAAKAKSTLGTLGDQLHQDAAKIKETAQGISGAAGSVEAVSVISSTLVTMRDQVKAAGNTLRELPTGELKDAVDSSSSCQTLKGEAA